MTIYVLEGPDLAGKTTLADAIHTHHMQLGHVVNRIKVNQPTQSTQLALFNTYFTQISLAAAHDAEDVAIIIDRLHVGEWIYGPIKRANSLLSWEQIVALDHLLDSIKAKKIFVDLTYDNLVVRHSERGEDFVTVSELADISEEYRRVLYRHNDTRQPELFGWRRVFMDNQQIPAVWS